MSSSSTDSEAIYLAYAEAIRAISGVTTQAGSGQRLYVAPMSDYAIPSGKDISKNYENYNVYKFADNVPKDDQPVLNPSNISVVAAFAAYLADVDLSAALTESDEYKTAVALAQTDEKDKQAAYNATRAVALAQYHADCPNGYDETTGETVAFKDWYLDNYPEFGTAQAALKEASARVNELLDEAESNDLVKLIQTYRANLQSGQDITTYHPGFNLPANNTNPAAIATNPSTSNPQNLFYVPSFTIGGNFDAVVKRWVDSFPADYPGNRESYATSARAIRLEISSSFSWADFGFSSNASSSSSNSGWFIWGNRSSSSSSDTTHTVNISKNDFAKDAVVSFWGFGTFPIQYGQWYTGNPISAFPTLNPAGSSNPSIKNNLLQQYTSVTMGYGIEVSIKLTSSAYSEVADAINTAKSSSSGYVEFFGWSCGASSSESSTSSSWDNITMNDEEHSLTWHTDINRVPIVLAATSSRLTGV